MGVAAGPAGEVVLRREGPGPVGVLGEGAAGIEDFHEVDVRRDLLDGPVLERGAAEGLEGVGDVDEGPLLVDALDRLLRREAARHRLLEEHTHYLALGGQAFLRHDDLERRQLLHLQSPFGGAVVGDGDAVDFELPAALDDFIEPGGAVHRVVGVDVEVRLEHGG